MASAAGVRLQEGHARGNPEEGREVEGQGRMKPQPLIPREPRRLKQPTKARLREELARAATEIERLRIENEHLRTPWWRRLIKRKAA